MNIPQGIEGKASWISVVTSARVLEHPLVWSAMTAVFILIGYFWLQYYTLPYSTELAEENQTTVNVSSNPEKIDIGSQVKSHWNPDIYKKIDALEVMPISDLKDDTRADDYRRIIELEAKLLPLLESAFQYMNAENYVLPKEANAWSMYREVLTLDPAHGTAISGQQQILQTLQENAEVAVSKKQYENTERWLIQLDEIMPGNPFQTGLRKQIAEQISEELLQAEEAQKEVEKLSRLKAALDDANLTIRTDPPKLRAAFDLYARALEIDPENSTAISGLRNIHTIRIDRVKTAISLDDLVSAQEELARLEETDAPDEQLTNLIAAIDERQKEMDKVEQTKLAEENATEDDEANSKLQAQIAANQKALDSAAMADISLNDAGQNATIELTENSADPEASQQVPEEIAILFADKIEIQGVAVNAPTKPLDVVESATEEIADSDKKINQLENGINAYYAGDYNIAFEALHPLAEDGVARAQFRLGIMYFQGRTVVKNTDLATQWIAQALPTILRAAQQETAWAQSDLGTAYEMGIGVQKDLARSADWYKRAADLNYAGAQTNLGVLYGTGEGVNYDRQLAVYWLKRAAAQGDKVAQDNLKILNAR